MTSGHTNMLGRDERGQARLTAIDVGKGICILGVVVAHVFGGLTDAGVLDRRIAFAYGGVAYTFLMPFFFAAAGVFAVGSLRKGYGAFVLSKVQTIAWPFLVWVCIFALFIRFGSGPRNSGTDSAALDWIGHAWRRPPGHLWFLYALFLAFVIFAIVRAAKVPLILLFVATAIWRAMPDDGLREWAWAGPVLMQQNACFFFAGAACGPVTLSRLTRRVSPSLWLATATVCGAALLYADIRGILPAPIPVWWSAWVGLAFVSATSVLVDRSRLRPLMLWLGERSLPIYVAHVLFTAGTRTVLMRLGIHAAPVHVVVGFSAGLIGPLALYALSVGTPLSLLFRLGGRQSRRLPHAGHASADAAARSPSTDLSILIVSYNTLALTRDCLRSVAQHVPAEVSCQVIVVDNASSDGSVAMIRGEFPRVQVIENATNVGFGPANNQAAKMATGRHLLLLNSDAMLKADAIVRLRAALDADATVGIAAPKLLNVDGSLQPSVWPFPSPARSWIEALGLSRCMGWNWSLRDWRRWSYDRQTSVPWAIGACLLVRREVIDSVGLFDESFFLYGEETEWEYRVRCAGWDIVFVPDATVVHVGGASGMSQKARTRGLFFDGLDRYVKKHFGRGGLVSSRLSIIIGSLLRLPVLAAISLLPSRRVQLRTRCGDLLWLLRRQVSDWRLLRGGE